jgi:hypothetical protein
MFPSWRQNFPLLFGAVANGSAWCRSCGEEARSDGSAKYWARDTASQGGATRERQEGRLVADMLKRNVWTMQRQAEDPRTGNVQC